MPDELLTVRTMPCLDTRDSLARMIRVPAIASRGECSDVAITHEIQ